METKSWTYLDRSRWPSGPWTSEPDKVQWTDEDAGLPCLIVRNPWNGHLCGYVGVTEDHPAFEVNYDDVSVEAHGGLTFSDFCQPAEGDFGICHAPGPGEPDRVWWLGFDCAHSWDWSPHQEQMFIERRGAFAPRNETYKGVGYVRGQCRELARQLKEML